MPKIRLTDTNIKKIAPPAKGRETYRDTKISGFQLRVTSTGAKTFAVRADVNGKTVRVTLGRFPDLLAGQAEILAKDNLSKLAHKIDPNAEKKTDEAKQITLLECFEDYKRSRANLKANTVKEYGAILNQYLGDWLEKPLIDITRDKVEKRHKQIGKKSPSRANKTMRVLRALLEYAHGKYDDEAGNPIILFNPVKRLTHVKAWYKETRRITYIKPADLKPWFNAVNSAPVWLKSNDPELNRDYLLLLLFTGLRRREAAALQWQAIDFKDKTLTVTETKNSYTHVLPLSTFLVDMLKQRNKATKKSPYLFPSKGKKGYLIDPKKAVANIRDKSGVYFTPHDLRRTFITVAESLGIRDYVLKRLLNHRSGGDVTDGYIITDVERLRAPMQQITDKLLLLANPPANVVNLDLKKG